REHEEAARRAEIADRGPLEHGYHADDALAGLKGVELQLALGDRAAVAGIGAGHVHAELDENRQPNEDGKDDRVHRRGRNALLLFDPRRSTARRLGSRSVRIGWNRGTHWSRKIEWCGGPGLAYLLADKKDAGTLS